MFNFLFIFKQCIILKLFFDRKKRNESMNCLKKKSFHTCKHAHLELQIFLRSSFCGMLEKLLSLKYVLQRLKIILTREFKILNQQNS